MACIELDKLKHWELLVSVCVCVCVCVCVRAFLSACVLSECVCVIVTVSACVSVLYASSVDLWGFTTQNIMVDIYEQLIY